MKHHPDDHNGLLDWQIYGPKDHEIADLVYRLAYEEDMRLIDIEHIIKAALIEKLTSFRHDPVKGE